MKTVPHTFRDKVEIVMGDVTDYSKVLEVIQGTNGVVVTLGTRNNLEPTTVLSAGLENILKAMKEASVQKISVCLSSFLFYEPDKVPTIFEHINLEHRRMLDLVKSAEFAEWRAVLPPHIAGEYPACSLHTVCLIYTLINNLTQHLNEKKIVIKMR